jgi:hypothetical protein
MRERRLLQQAGDYVRLRQETNVQRIDASRQIDADKKNAPSAMLMVREDDYCFPGMTPAQAVAGALGGCEPPDQTGFFSGAP